MSGKMLTKMAVLMRWGQQAEKTTNIMSTTSEAEGPLSACFKDISRCRHTPKSVPAPLYIYLIKLAQIIC